MSRRPSRPRGLLISALLATVVFAACEPAGKPTETTPPPAQPGTPPVGAVVHVRKEIHQLTAAEVDAYRKGVALMQQRAPTDPTSWIYQANIHGFPTSSAICAVTSGPPQPAWSTCTHGNFFFLAWHRMYLYYFEQILRTAVRQAVGDPSYELNLPYWDYENPAYHDLPEPFRVPGDSSNPLFVAQRVANCNDGEECVSAEVASAQQALSLIPFCNCPDDGSPCTGCTEGLFPDEAFGGQLTPMPVHSASGFGELESQPHNVVHDAIGGSTGWMSYLQCAARDPIFWLHHANIDRLWQVWLNQGGGRENPLGSDEWKNQSFTFFDDQGMAKTFTACQILDMATQLDYQYEGVPVENVQLCTAPAAASQAAPSAPKPAARKVLVSSQPSELRLGSAPVTVSLPAVAEVKQRLTALAAGGPGHLRVVVEGIRLVAPGAFYQVYLDLPEGQTPDPKGPHFLGLIDTFGEIEHATDRTRSFDITGKLAALREKGLMEGPLRVTFVRGNPPPAAKAAAEPGVFLSFRRVSLIER